MKKTSCKRGFTLIELLVVVLIIGILAAVALPQYQKAVEKSKAHQALIVLKHIVDAQKVYYLANGRYATLFNQLGIDIPATGNTRWRTDAIADTRSNEEWSWQIRGAAIYAGRLTGPYKGTGFVYLLYSDDVLEKGLYCVDKRANGPIVPAGKYRLYCQKLLGGQEVIMNYDLMNFYTVNL